MGRMIRRWRRRVAEPSARAGRGVRQWAAIPATRPLDHRSSLTQLVRPEEHAIEEVVGRYQRVAPAVTVRPHAPGNPQLVVRLGPESSAGADEIVCDPRVFQAAYAVSAPVTPDEVAIASRSMKSFTWWPPTSTSAGPVPEVFAPTG